MTLSYKFGNILFRRFFFFAICPQTEIILLNCDWLFVFKTFQNRSISRSHKSHTPRTSTIGGSYSKKILEFLTVDPVSTRRDEHAYIGHSSERAFFELGVFECWKFCPKISKIQKPLTRKILLAQKIDLYRRVRLVEYY